MLCPHRAPSNHLVALDSHNTFLLVDQKKKKVKPHYLLLRPSNSSIKNSSNNTLSYLCGCFKMVRSVILMCETDVPLFVSERTTYSTNDVQYVPYCLLQPGYNNVQQIISYENAFALKML